MVMEPKPFEKAKKILSLGPVCDHCLGRQFGQLLKGFSNAERGRALRLFLAFCYELETFDADKSNFSGIGFRQREVKAPPSGCFVCGGFFENIGKYVKMALGRLRGIEFSSFVVGTKLSEDLVINEEGLWETIGIDYCEPIKAEINREVGKRLEKELRKKADFDRPEVVVVLDIGEENVEVQINPLFILAGYQKLVRGIPQTKWPSGKYKTSVEQIIAKPFMKASKGKAHALHGCGREDIDARCLAWRPFVLEITYPKVRKLALARLAKEVNKNGKVRIRGLRAVGKDVVTKIKDIRPEKTYKAIVRIEGNVEKGAFRKITALRTTVLQQTPERVLHRRADRLRKRRIKDVRWKMLGKNRMELVFRTDAGTYIKELISGDNGRTSPSLAEILGVQATCEALDVTGIHVKEKL